MDQAWEELPGKVLATQKADGNQLKLVLNGKEGKLFLNGRFIADLDVSANLNSGDVAVEVALKGYPENVDVAFEEFRISELK